MSLDNNCPSALKLEPWSNKRLIGGFLITDGIGPGVKYSLAKLEPWSYVELNSASRTELQASSGKLQAASNKLDKINIL
jgi:hypothetical protein